MEAMIQPLKSSSPSELLRVRPLKGLCQSRLIKRSTCFILNTCRLWASGTPRPCPRSLSNLTSPAGSHNQYGQEVAQYSFRLWLTPCCMCWSLLALNLTQPKITWKESLNRKLLEQVACEACLYGFLIVNRCGKTQPIVGPGLHERGES